PFSKPVQDLSHIRICQSFCDERRGSFVYESITVPFQVQSGSSRLSSSKQDEKLIRTTPIKNIIFFMNFYIIKLYFNGKDFEVIGSGFYLFHPKESPDNNKFYWQSR